MEIIGVRPVRIVEIVNPFQPDAHTGEALLAPIPGEYLADCDAPRRLECRGLMQSG